MVQNKNNLELEIILVLIKNKSHLREIARILNESHSTILRKVNELLKENILDYKITQVVHIFCIVITASRICTKL